MTPMEAHLLRAYLDGELDAEAAAEFEVLMLQRDDIAELVHADTALRIGLGGKSAAGDAPQNVVPLKPRGGRFPGWWKQALAASVLLAVGFGAANLRQHDSETGPAQINYIDKMRGANDVPIIRIPKSGYVVLAVPVVDTDGCTPTVELRRGSEKLLSSIAVSNDSGYATLVVPAVRLTSGSAMVRVQCGQEFDATYGIALRQE